MGAAESSIPAAYTFNENDLISTDSAGLFKYIQVHHKQTREPFGLFIRQRTPNDLLDTVFFENAIMKLKTIRHPGIIKYLNSEISPSGIFVLTEPVRPLSAVISELGAEEICVGIYHIIRTLAFLHQNSFCHNFIHQRSIYVTLDNRWVLGNLEFVSDTASNNALLGSLIPSEINPREHENSTFFTRDMYALGLLIRDLVDVALKRNASQHAPGIFDWREATRIAHLLISFDPRGTTSWLLQQDLFLSNTLIQIMDFLSDIRAFHFDEKIQWFGNLSSNLRKLPRTCVERYVVPKLLKLDFLTEPGAILFYSELFSQSNIDTSDTPAPVSQYQEDDDLVSSIAYKVNIVSFIKDMFKSHEYEVRILLLSCLSSYIDAITLLDPDMLESVIVYELILGVDEVDDIIYYGSLSGLIRAIYPYCKLLERKTQTAPTSEQHPSFSNMRRGITPSGIVAATSIDDDHDMSHSLPSTTSSTRPRAASSSSRFSLIGLVENLIIPHCIKLCTDDAEINDAKWTVLSDLVDLWKQLCIYISKQPTYSSTEVSRIIRSLLKMFHLILRALQPEQKIFFMVQRLVGALDHVGDPNIVVWVPKIMELLIPFLKDESRDVRKETATLFGRLVSVMSATTDRVTSVSKKRDPSGLVSRLKTLYGPMSRTNKSFHHSGPRVSHPFYPPGEHRQSFDRSTSPVSRNANSRKTSTTSPLIDSKPLSIALPDKEMLTSNPSRVTTSIPLSIPVTCSDDPADSIHSISPDRSSFSDTFQSRRDVYLGRRTGSIVRKMSMGSDIVRTKIKVEEVPIASMPHNAVFDSLRQAKPPSNSQGNLSVRARTDPTSKSYGRLSLDRNQDLGGGWNEELDEDLELNDITL